MPAAGAAVRSVVSEAARALSKRAESREEIMKEAVLTDQKVNEPFATRLRQPVKEECEETVAQAEHNQVGPSQEKQRNGGEEALALVNMHHQGVRYLNEGAIYLHKHFPTRGIELEGDDSEMFPKFVRAAGRDGDNSSGLLNLNYAQGINYVPAVKFQSNPRIFADAEKSSDSSMELESTKENQSDDGKIKSLITAQWSATYSCCSARQYIGGSWEKARTKFENRGLLVRRGSLSRERYRPDNPFPLSISS